MSQFEQSNNAAGTPPPGGNAMDPLIGRTLEGKYRLDALLGAGGMGTVYRATRLMIGDAVAIKILHSQQVADPHAIERFRREAQAAARLKHQNAVAIYDFGVSNEGLVYLVMELAEGQSLRDIIKQYGHVTPSGAANIMSQVCAAIDEAHRQNIVHRDLKPDNIIVAATNTGLRAKVLDFGIAKMCDLTASNLTLTGSVMGTPYYMSPEHCMGEEIDHRSDIYSLGIVLFEMLAGVVPFNSPTSTAVVVAHVNQAPPSLRALNANISPAVEAVVMHALEKRREARPQTAVQLAQELIASVQGRPLTPHSGSIPVSTFNSTPASTTPAANPVVGAELAPTMQMKITSVIGGARTAAPAKKRLPLMLGVAVVIMIAAIVLMWSQREKTSSPAITGAAEPLSVSAQPVETKPGYVEADISRAQNQDTAVIDKSISKQESRESGYEYKDARKVIAGDLNGDSVPDLAVLYTLEGAYGANNYARLLAVFIRAEGKLVPVTHTVIGAKGIRHVELQSIRNNVIFFKTFNYGPNDPACCPSKKGTTRFVLVNGRLKER